MMLSLSLSLIVLAFGAVCIFAIVKGGTVPSYRNDPRLRRYEARKRGLYQPASAIIPGSAATAPSAKDD